MEWYWILIISLSSVLLLFLLTWLLYKPVFKRFWDIVLSFIGILVLSPILLIFSIAGAIAMRGNPFFTQERPGKNEKIFKLVKFRSMNNKKDKDGNLLPDEKRLSGYGKFIRKTSIDELPELFNIFVGHMSIVGPRPLLVRYLPRYNEEQHHRHDVRPGLTGYAQCHGRNLLTWEEKFKMDVFYVNHYSLFLDISILFKTLTAVFKHSGINSGTSATMEEFFGDE